MPTRLLDWTKNPLAGLWFAVREPLREGQGDGIVWVFRPEAKDLIKPLTTHQSPFDGARTKVFAPAHVTARIRAQDGMFTVHKFIEEKNSFIPLQTVAQLRSKFHKLVVPSVHFRDLRYDLDRCGVHASAFFPDLSGLASRIEWQNAMWEDET